MNNFYYSTDSEEHLTNIKEKQEELEDVIDETDYFYTWDNYMDSDHPCVIENDMEEADYDAIRLATI